MGKILVNLENLKTNETATLELYAANNDAVGKLLPMAFKGDATANSSTIWQPLDNWAIRDIIQDGGFTAGQIRLMESTQPTALTCLLASQGPTNPGRTKFAFVLAKGLMYSFQVTTQLSTA